MYIYISSLHHISSQYLRSATDPLSQVEACRFLLEQRSFVDVQTDARAVDGVVVDGVVVQQSAC